MTYNQARAITFRESFPAAHTAFLDEFMRVKGEQITREALGDEERPAHWAESILAEWRNWERHAIEAWEEQHPDEVEEMRKAS